MIIRRKVIQNFHIHHHHHTNSNLYQTVTFNNTNTNTIVTSNQEAALCQGNKHPEYHFIFHNDTSPSSSSSTANENHILGLIIDRFCQLLARVLQLLIIIIPIIMSTISNSNQQQQQQTNHSNKNSNNNNNGHHSPVGHSTPLVSPKYYFHNYNYPNISHFKASKHILGRNKLISSSSGGGTSSNTTNHPPTPNYSHGIVAPQPLASVTTEADEEKQQQGAILTFSAIFYKLLIFVISFLPLFVVEKLLTFFAWVQLELLKAKAKNINPDQTFSSLKKKRKAKKVKKLKPILANSQSKASTIKKFNSTTPSSSSSSSLIHSTVVEEQPSNDQSSSSSTIVEESNLSNERSLEQPSLSIRPPPPPPLSVTTTTDSPTTTTTTTVDKEEEHGQNHGLIVSANGIAGTNTPIGTGSIQLSPSSSCSSLLVDHPELMLRNQQLHRLLQSPMPTNSNSIISNHHQNNHHHHLSLPTSHSVGDSLNNLELMGRPRSDSMSMLVPEAALGGRSFAEIRRVNSEATLYQTSEETLLFEANQKSRKEFEDFLRSVKDIKDVRSWLQNFSGEATRKIAIVKISRRILETQYGIDQAASSLCFMFKFGLLPIVIHGGLNDITRLPYDQVINERRIRSAALKEAIKKNGVGSTVLSPDICEIKPVVAEEEYDNQDSPSSDTLSEEELEFGRSGILPNGGLTMKIESFDYDLLTQALEKGKIPIWDSVAETTEGIEIPINSDVTTFELAKLIQPFKIIFACNDGGILDVDHKAIPVVYLDQDYRALLEADHTTERRRVQLKQMKRIVDHLPTSTSVIVTSIEAIAHQILFPRLATGTIVKRREDNRVMVYNRHNFETVDLERLRTLIQDSFGRALSEDYFDYLRDNLYALYICVSADDQYMGCAIVTFKKPDYIPYLCKFCVQRSAQGLGLGDLIWRSLQRDIEQLYWRSRNNNPLNPWYFSRCQGSFRADEHFTVFWYGDDKFEDGSLMIEEALRKPITVLPMEKKNQ